MFSHLCSTNYQLEIENGSANTFHIFYFFLKLKHGNLFIIIPIMLG